ncbi:gliding motility-associated C-terminal domain-containing protein [Spirosoma sp. BT702]|uniref:Gliding motility-associated C-terminal domain-containing protein n=1 Tax=Spirosoma profusum TaxID=2771354 RepID=A0A926XSU9_9BACT|nr:gliding motility-associated C-terminal domain-containing protein [Spirosoma profusum]MBD2699172.1 gliding motility-associated C-terminal domain-containing protein [Spirosoma profusum]
MVRFCLLILLAFAFDKHQAVAQKGVFDVRLGLKKVDCERQKVLVAVEIKAHDGSSEFLMGNANFRFLYDARFLQHPVLLEQHNFSSYNGADLNYSPQSLTGSSERLDKGIISLNIIHSGTEQTGSMVGSNEWTMVSTIQFDIVHSGLSQSTNLVWNDDKTFPVTGLSEVVAKKNSSAIDSYVVKAGGVFQNLTLNPFTEICGGLGLGNTDNLMIPEGFSPNGDGINDVFVIHNLGALKADVTIFNMNGHIVYTNPNYQNDWGGQSEQGTIPDGTYFYSIRFSDGRSFRRSMTITH